MRVLDKQQERGSSDWQSLCERAHAREHVRSRKTHCFTRESLSKRQGGQGLLDKKIREPTDTETERQHVGMHTDRQIGTQAGRQAGR